MAIITACTECNAEISLFNDVTYRDPRGNEVDFIEDVDEMFMRLLVLQVLLDVRAPGAERIACVEHLHHDVRRVDDLVELAPHALRLARLAVDLHRRVLDAALLTHQVAVLLALVRVTLLVRRAQQLLHERVHNIT